MPIFRRYLLWVGWNYLYMWVTVLSLSSKIKSSLNITAFVMCHREICSDISYCNPSASCSNCIIPQRLNCICYGGKDYIVISILYFTLFFQQNVVLPVWMEEDVSTIIPANVLHTGLENTVKKVCHLLPMLTHIQTVLYLLATSLLPLWPV